MAQSFSPGVNIVARWLPPLVVFGGIFAIALSALGTRSNFSTGVGLEIEQPIPFSHRHHVKGLGLDCRFCHSKAENSADAGMPDTHTCMGCHSQIWAHEEILAPLRESFRTKIPIQWNRVTQLPDHVFFNHSAHVNKGIGCVSCHGKVSEMPIAVKARAFTMSECLGCHKNPDPYLRPASEVVNESWHSLSQGTLGPELRQIYEIHPTRLIQCSTCHR